MVRQWSAKPLLVSSILTWCLQKFMYNDYHDQARKMAEEILTIVRRYGMEYDIDVSSVLGVLELVKYDVYTSALNDADEQD